MQDGYEKLQELVLKHDTNCSMALLDKAYKLSKEAHNGQTRISGEPFINHPIEVACILAELELDCASVIAGILHDTIEDTTFTYEQLKAEFGEEIASLVDGVTKLGKIPFTTKEEQQAENLRKMFMATAKDVRVILIKLADRLHNMRTLKYHPAARQIEIARETIEIYAPIAHRLGMSKLKWELEDICLRYLDPKGYYDLVENIQVKRKEREDFINLIISTLKAKTTELGIEAHIDGRPKHFYSIYRKMTEQNKTLEQIYDLFAVRVIVDSVKDCYAVLGLVHELYKPLPGRFKDYIAMPKPNMYQSLHTTLMGNEGATFEVQIRTWEMHRIAEVGIAAHWKYKQGVIGKSELDSKLAWLRQLLEWQKDTRDAGEYLEALKVDLFTDEVFVFTPKGDVINLRAGSTPIDFAYAIHSAVGNKMMGAKVNGRIVQLNSELKTGDIIEILTSSAVRGPSHDWLKIVKTSQAKNKINQWFKKEKRDENIVHGRDQVEKELKKFGIPQSVLTKDDILEPILRRYAFNTLEDMFASIGFGSISAGKVVARLREELRRVLKPEELIDYGFEPSSVQNVGAPAGTAGLRDKDKDNDKDKDKVKSKSEQKKRSKPPGGINVKGIDNCLVRLSRCCNPVPGDEIAGYITRGRGVSVHRKDCINAQIGPEVEEERLIEVSWYKEATESAYKAEIALHAHDRTSLLMEIANIISEAKIPLKAMNARTTKEHMAIMNLTLEITGTDQLDKIIKKLKKVEGVSEVSRN
ncbi:MAG: bifunctional (p)ppGpp synthetase/guanosine-3',5'-bis(diphosphate) 3'-pyrophosphohydrolase [Clostridiales bacterium]|nr:bifunctional (p)ppGpp synthetase/guanosine-3',5'-bis(diphosphate) 3'-pyrophosphohydrolase [Clostridiales bacterium]